MTVPTGSPICPVCSKETDGYASQPLADGGRIHNACDEAQRFFYEHAGYSYHAETETADEGRLRCARELAIAEAKLKAGPYFVSAEPDPLPWEGDEPYDGPLWVVLLWSAVDTYAPEVLGSLGSVACEEGDDYLRVVAAELALEHLSR